jgi:hypothetical protein
MNKFIYCRDDEEDDQGPPDEDDYGEDSKP